MKEESNILEKDSFNSLTNQEEIEVRTAYKNKLALALTLKRKREAETEIVSEVIKPTVEAFIAAYPLMKFMEEGFPVVVQGKEFAPNWHIDVICELIQAALLRQVKNNIVNIPRRTMKSTLMCIFFPAYAWIVRPELKFLYTSYSAGFAERDNQATGDLIKSDFYKQRFGNKFFLTKDTKKKIQNSKGGSRSVFKIGKGTGEGGDILVADDPNAIDETESDTILNKTITGWNEISYHNVTNRDLAIRFIVQQRTNQRDLTGALTEDLELQKLYNVLCLAMEYESDNPLANTTERPFYLGKVTVFDKNQNPNLILGDSKFWVDPRDLDAHKFENNWYQEWYRQKFIEKGLISKGEGQYLWESFISDESIRQEKAHLKAYGYAAQYQQRPNIRGGNFFKSDEFLMPDKSTLPLSSIDLNNMAYCRYWDKAGTENGGDWTVGMLVGRTAKRPYQVYIIDVIRKQIGYYERMQLMKDTAAQDTMDYVNTKENTEYSIGIEREGAASGKDLAAIEREALLGYDVFTETPRGNKNHRAMLPKSVAESGRLKVIRAHWNAGFLQRLEKFDPNKTNNVDDEIDTLSGCLRKLILGNNRRGGSRSGVN